MVNHNSLSPDLTIWKWQVNNCGNSCLCKQKNLLVTLIQPGLSLILLSKVDKTYESRFIPWMSVTFNITKNTCICYSMQYISFQSNVFILIDILKKSISVLNEEIYIFLQNTQNFFFLNSNHNFRHFITILHENSF